LNEISEIIGGGTPSTDVSAYWNGEFDWYAPAEINDQIFVNRSERKITKLGLEKSSARLLPANRTVLFTSRAGIGKTAILSREGATNQGFQSMVLKEKINTYFVYSMTHLIKDKAEKIASGSTFTEISGKMLGNLGFMFPNSDEQEKIGMLFYSIDNLITLHQHKGNVMDLDFRKVKNNYNITWEQRKVKEICSISTGKSNTQDKIDDGKYPFYVRSDIVEHSNRYLYDEEAVLTVGDGVGTGKVFHYVKGRYDLHQRVYRCFDFSKNVSAKYFYYYFSKNFYDRVMSMTAKTSVDSVRYEMIADMDFISPRIEEQNKIVNVLSNLDNLITLHQHKYNKMKEGVK
jgi:type I restriction enzyme S subunit